MSDVPYSNSLLLATSEEQALRRRIAACLKAFEN